MGEMHITGTNAALLALRALPPKEFALLAALRPGRRAKTDDLVDALWGGGANGGPLDAGQVIHTLVSNLRRRGYRISSQWGVGYDIDGGAGADP